MGNDLRARPLMPGDELQKEIRAVGRGTAGRREQHARDDGREKGHSRTARVDKIGIPQPRLKAGIVSGGSNVADAAMGAGFKVAGQVVVGKRQGGERGDIRRDDELENHTQPAP